MLQKTLLLLFIVVSMAASCNGPSGDEGSEVQVNDQPDKPIPVEERKYGIREGIVTYENIMKTHSVDIRFKTVVYFDDYGLKERKDIYTGDTQLDESLMSDGKSVYKINHKLKTIFKLRDAYRGTEPKFGWDNVSAEDKESGKVQKDADTVIAGLTCRAYHIETNQVRADYAGWENILMYSEISSPGGKSLAVAVKVDTGYTDDSKFLLPKGYKFR